MSSTASDNVPALPPPPGVIPNFINPYSQNPAFVATAVLCLSFATASVVVRLTTSLRGPNKRLQIEDCKSLQSLIFALPEALNRFANINSYLHYSMGGWSDILSEVDKLIAAIDGTDCYLCLDRPRDSQRPWTTSMECPKV